jgi:hypothetical protein
MFRLLDNAIVIFYSKPVSLIKSIDALTAVIQVEMGMQPDSGIYFLFCNVKKDRFKILYKDGDNLAIWFKRFSGSLKFEYSNEIEIFDKDGFLKFLNKTCYAPNRRIKNFFN